MPKTRGRLTEPLVRENGSLRPATWDEALDRAAEGFRAAVAAGGPNAFGLFSCSKASNEVNFMTQKFARVVLGTKDIDFRARPLRAAGATADSVGEETAFLASNVVGRADVSYADIDAAPVVWAPVARLHPSQRRHLP